jgi:hypothetical protein
MRPSNNRLLLPLLFVVALIGYLVPWVLTPASSLNLGAYDLAEWSSLHPLVRQTTPFLWTSLALRLPLAILGILLAAHISNQIQRRFIAIGCLLITSVALLPPLEFFTVYRDDPNYRQQFILALLTLLSGIVVTMWESKKHQVLILIALSGSGVVASATGLYQAQSLLHGFDLHPTIGLGGVVTTIALAVASIQYITKQSS